MSGFTFRSSANPSSDSFATATSSPFSFPSSSSSSPSPFASSTNPSSATFGFPPSTTIASSSSFGFGSTPTPSPLWAGSSAAIASASTLFGATPSAASSNPSTTPSLFRTTPSAATALASTLFGATPSAASSNPSTTPSLFRTAPSAATSSPLFGPPSPAANATPSTTSTSLFGATTFAAKSILTPSTTTTSLFGGTPSAANSIPTPSTTISSQFGTTPSAAAPSPLFGSSSSAATGSTININSSSFSTSFSSSIAASSAAVSPVPSLFGCATGAAASSTAAPSTTSSSSTPAAQTSSSLVAASTSGASSSVSGTESATPKLPSEIIGRTVEEDQYLNKVGTWGGSGGREWSYVAKGGISEIVVSSGWVIDSLIFKGVDENGKDGTSQKFGGSGGGSTKITIDWPKEYLTSISGTYYAHYGQIVVESLYFYTNRTKYGPFGRQLGTPFKLPLEDREIVGFFGRATDFIDAIGVYQKGSSIPIVTDKESIPHSSLITVGPWGGPGGCEWNYVAKSGISEIVISVECVVDSLTFKGVDDNCKGENSKKFGGKGGESTVIMIDWPKEYLTSISGTYNTYKGHCVVESLCFYTNCTKFGPYGYTNGTPFKFPLEDREIVGFFGRAGDFIDAVGVYQKSPSIPIVTIKANEGITMSMDLPREIGPWGGNKGKAWDDGIFVAIQQIDVHVRDGVVVAIQCKYHGKDDKPVWSKRQGGGSATTIYRIELEHYSSENLVGISGFYGPLDGNCYLEVVRSISFYTNKGKYGPFGTEIGTFFNSTVSNAKVVGFHGKSGEYLDAIGVHVDYS
ncbi:hypothetical protein ACOSQ3_020179 [Xanthoceras sorbifolium]